MKYSFHWANAGWRWVRRTHRLPSPPEAGRRSKWSFSFIE